MLRYPTPTFGGAGAGGARPGAGGLELETIPPSVKERLLRLEQENKRLREAVEESKKLKEAAGTSHNADLLADAEGAEEWDWARYWERRWEEERKSGRMADEDEVFIVEEEEKADDAPRIAEVTDEEAEKFMMEEEAKKFMTEDEMAEAEENSAKIARDPIQ